MTLISSRIGALRKSVCLLQRLGARVGDKPQPAEIPHVALLADKAHAGILWLCQSSWSVLLFLDRLDFHQLQIYAKKRGVTEPYRIIAYWRFCALILDDYMLYTTVYN